MNKIKASMILLPLIGLIFAFLYSCSHGYLKQDIRGIFKPIIYVLKINREALKSDKAKLQHFLNKRRNIEND